jgi:hypothetical protein
MSDRGTKYINRLWYLNHVFLVLRRFPIRICDMFRDEEFCLLGVSPKSKYDSEEHVKSILKIEEQVKQETNMKQEASRACWYIP